MGSFKGHALPGTLFLAVGVWHIWSAVVRYASDPANFRVNSWSPVGAGKLQYLELYLVTGGAFLDMCVELLYSTHLRWFVGGALNPNHMNDFEHGGMLLMFFLFGAAALLSQKTRYCPLPEGALCLLAATAFTSEYLLFYFHSTSHKGLEGYYHFLLVVLVGLCVVATVTATLAPTSFVVDLASGIAVTLQGLWFYQTAFTLYGPMMPQGCELKDDSILCHSPSAEVRGELLANFQFFGLIVLVFIVALGAYSYAALNYGGQQLISYLDGENERSNGYGLGS